MLGTATLLNGARRYWKEENIEGRFYHISTDEVYGELGDTGYFREDTSYNPRSPYSASKAGSDHLVRAYHATYGFSVIFHIQPIANVSPFSIYRERQAFADVVDHQRD